MLTRSNVLVTMTLLGGGCSSDDPAAPAPPTCIGDARADAWVSDPDLCVSIYATGLGRARQIAFAPNGDLFVNNGVVTALWDDNGSGSSGADERATFASAPGLNHGLAFSPDEAYLYASSDTTIFRWPYVTGMRQAGDAPEIAIANLPAAGSHNTRTIAFDSRGRLYVNVGSHGNVDIEPALWSTRGQIRRFDLSALPPGGIDYAAGEVVASGMRNEVGLFIDRDDRLWGVENGRDFLTDEIDIHNANPAEEFNLIDGQGSTFYGYPFCYSEGALAGGGGPGTQWADETLDPSIRKTDAWCRDPSNVHPPAFALPAHWAPLGIAQVRGAALGFAGDFIIPSHGSWNADPPQGRLIARVSYRDGEFRDVAPIVGGKGVGDELAQGAWDARPVDVREGPDEAIYFSDDEGGRVFKIGREAP